MASVLVGWGEPYASENLGSPLGKLSGIALEQDSGKVAPQQWMAGHWQGEMVAVGAGQRDCFTFNNGNMHFTNERISSREVVFLATVALCFKGVCFI